MITSRKTAYNILTEILSGGYLNLVAKKYLNLLSGDEDKKFCLALVSATLENLIYIDYILGLYLKKQPQKSVKNVLRLGVSQIIFMDSVPVHAAVSESVILCSYINKSQLKGFVNAVLRKISREYLQIDLPDINNNPVYYLSLKYSYPEWICKMLVDQYGFEFTESLLSYKIRKDMTCFRLVQGCFPQNSIVSQYLNNVFYIENATSIENNPLYCSGFIAPMGESSVLCVDAAGINKSHNVLDVCAAPGGKSAYASTKCNKIVSCDVSPARVNLIKNTFNRLHVDNYSLLCHDAKVYNNDFDSYFDVVICDVPCSSFGLMYRKPDIKFNKTTNDINSLILLQADILDNSSRYVKTGGVIQYSTCSINKFENIIQIEKFLLLHDNFILDDFSMNVPEKFKDRAKKGFVQIFPNSDNIDGFFIARLRRIR